MKKKLNKKKKTLEDLKKFLLENDIPKLRGKPQTFFGIAKQPHYEDVLTNWYAFFLDENEEHNFHDLFIQSLLELIQEKIGDIESNTQQKKELRFDTGFTCVTQKTTLKNGRIDLVIESTDTAIIIENKIYHFLANDLGDYWSSTQKQSKNKIGIVLTLQPKPYIDHPHFINLTHVELLAKIYNNIGSYLVEATPKYITFLNDFHQNIINLSAPVMNPKNLNFYYQFQQEINELVTYKNKVREYIEEEIKKSFSILTEKEKLNVKLNESKGNLGKRITYFEHKENKDLMFTISYHGLLEEEHFIRLIVELKGKALKNKEVYGKIKFNDQEKELISDSFYTSTNKAYAHFAIKTYHLKESEIENLGEYIAEKLEEKGFISIFKKLEAELVTA